METLLEAARREFPAIPWKEAPGGTEVRAYVGRIVVGACCMEDRARRRCGRVRAGQLSPVAVARGRRRRRVRHQGSRAVPHAATETVKGRSFSNQMEYANDGETAA